MTKSEQLFDAMRKTVNPYPPSMVEIEGKLDKCCAFFPAGSGYRDVSDNNSEKPYLCLGQDWQLFANYETVVKSKNYKYDLKSPTFIKFSSLLKDVGINENDCFFTNAIMGARANGEKATGKSPAFKSPEFVDRCGKFFEKQLSIINPKTVIVFGAEPAKFLAHLSDKLKVWEKFKNFKEIDEAGHQIIRNVEINGVTCNYVLIVHPSYRHTNVKTRSYKKFECNKAEIAMLKDAMKEQI